MSLRWGRSPRIDVVASWPRRMAWLATPGWCWRWSRRRRRRTPGISGRPRSRRRTSGRAAARVAISPGRTSWERHRRRAASIRRSRCRTPRVRWTGRRLVRMCSRVGSVRDGITRPATSNGRTARARMTRPTHRPTPMRPVISAGALATRAWCGVASQPNWCMAPTGGGPPMTTVRRSRKSLAPSTATTTASTGGSPPPTGLASTSVATRCSTGRAAPTGR